MEQGGLPKDPQIRMYEGKKNVMTFEEFIGAVPVFIPVTREDDRHSVAEGDVHMRWYHDYSNFFLMFNFVNDKYMQRFIKEHPDKYKSIIDRSKEKKLPKPHPSPRHDHNFSSQYRYDESFERESYEAYKILRSYGAADRDIGVT